MFGFEVSPEALVAIVAAVLALVFDWSPFVAKWYNDLSEVVKRVIMGGLLALTSIIIFSGDCYGLFNTVVECTWPGAAELFKLFAEALVINFGVHKVTKPSALKKSAMFG